MTTPTDTEIEQTVSTDEDPPAPRNLRRARLAVIAVAALTISVAAGWLVGNRDQPSSIGSGSVDAGFARDMSTHHDQAVQMAGYTRDHTSNSSIELLAFDIETSQYTELGQMQGWLDGWGLSRVSSRPVMSWMAGHSQGGLPMAQYAAEHAKEPYVRNLAQKMAQSQSNEIVQMEQLLRQLGGSPLPAPD